MKRSEKTTYPQDDFAILNYLPESSFELLERLQSILNKSDSWKAKMVYVDRQSGEYRIMVSGTNHQLDFFEKN